MKNEPRKLATIAILSGISAILAVFLRFNLPFMPSFIKMDLAKLPAIIATYSMGPFSGISVCLLKNIITIPFSSTFIIGPLANFLLECSFILPLGIIYVKNKSKYSAILSCIVGSLSMAITSFPINYYILYPIYFQIISENKILNMYQAIFPQINSISEALLTFNVPFTLLKGLLVSFIASLLYKRLPKFIKDI
ncbi:MAG: ECF transporter S component [Oscillospiraceae bacterium]|jgi:riboflavin transporter FmnP|nr:ECF transporter S component [Oscillospiraceae bacterium]